MDSIHCGDNTEHSDVMKLRHDIIHKQILKATFGELA